MKRCLCKFTSLPPKWNTQLRCPHYFRFLVVWKQCPTNCCPIWVVVVVAHRKRFICHFCSYYYRYLVLSLIFCFLSSQGSIYGFTELLVIRSTLFDKLSHCKQNIERYCRYTHSNLESKHYATSFDEHKFYIAYQNFKCTEVSQGTVHCKEWLNLYSL